MIRLGFCFDLLEPENVNYLREIYEEYRQTMELAGEALPENNRKYRKLDCAVFEYAYNVIRVAPDHSSVQTTRGVYVPAGGERRVWDASWISRETHIQLCVRNPACILGTWLHHPTDLRLDDVKKTLEDGEIGVESEDPQGGEALSNDAERTADRSDGGGEGADTPASGTGEAEMG